MRFLYTADTAKSGQTVDAVTHYEQVGNKAHFRLLRQALAWREGPIIKEEAISLVRSGLIPLYLEFIDRYIALLRELGKPEIVARLGNWRAQFAA